MAEGARGVLGTWEGPRFLGAGVLGHPVLLGGAPYEVVSLGQKFLEHRDAHRGQMLAA